MAFDCVGYASIEVRKMAKAGMKRSNLDAQTEGNPKAGKQKNDVPPVPEIQGKAKHGHEKAGRIN